MLGGSASHRCCERSNALQPDRSLRWPLPMRYRAGSPHGARGALTDEMRAAGMCRCESNSLTGSRRRFCRQRTGRRAHQATPTRGLVLRSTSAAERPTGLVDTCAKPINAAHSFFTATSEPRPGRAAFLRCGASPITPLPPRCQQRLIADSLRARPAKSAVGVVRSSKAPRGVRAARIALRSPRARHATLTGSPWVSSSLPARLCTGTDRPPRKWPSNSAEPDRITRPCCRRSQIILDYTIVHIAGAAVTPGSIAVGMGVILLRLSSRVSWTRNSFAARAQRRPRPGAQFAASRSRQFAGFSRSVRSSP